MTSGKGFIALHTGAGNCIDVSKYQLVIKDTCVRAIDSLRNGRDALSVVTQAISNLENNAATNAGYGSNLTFDGLIEMDASIMDGSTLNFGACTNVSDVKNPIELAKKICEFQNNPNDQGRLPPMILSGKGASDFARLNGLTMTDPEKMISSKASFFYKHYKNKILKKKDEQIDNIPLTNAIIEIPNLVMEERLDTVGAICIDSQGNAAAGCSSGGVILKATGRVGQAASFGAGCWAEATDNKVVATCTTGNGEYLMKTLLAKEICCSLDKADIPATAMYKTFKDNFLDSKYLPRNEELYGGALSLTYEPDVGSGEVIWSHTTQSFCLGFMSTNQKVPKVSCFYGLELCDLTVSDVIKIFFVGIVQCSGDV